mgnify:CR=1 FL=1
MAILDYCAQKTRRPTRIMYKANLSWVPLQQFLKLLTGKGLLSETAPHLFMTTDAGREYMQRTRTITTILEGEDEEAE